MAVDWIPWVKGLVGRQEVIAMAAALGLSRFDIAGRCMKLWEWCDDEGDFDDSPSRNCHVPNVPLDYIDAHVEQKNFADSMVKVGWVKVKKGGLFFPHLGEHIGKSARERKLGVLRKRAWRRKSHDENGSSARQRGERREESSKPPVVPRGGTVEKRMKKPDVWGQGILKAIYEAYPRKKSRGQAIPAIAKALERLSKDHEDPTVWLLDRVQAYAKLREAAADPEHTPYPATWMNAEGYHDEPEQPTSTDRNPSRVRGPGDKYDGVVQELAGPADANTTANSSAESSPGPPPDSPGAAQGV